MPFPPNPFYLSGLHSVHIAGAATGWGCGDGDGAGPSWHSLWGCGSNKNVQLGIHLAVVCFL